MKLSTFYGSQAVFHNSCSSRCYQVPKPWSRTSRYHWFCAVFCTFLEL